MAGLLDKLKQRGVERFKGITQSPGILPQTATSPLSQAPTDINRVAPRPQPSQVVSERISALPQRGTIGSLPQNKAIKNQIVADLPEKTQLEGIQGIINGQDIGNPVIDNFVKGMAAQGKTPEEIRQAFIEQQKTSRSPLVLL